MPDFRAQFREDKPESRVYMGGVTASCGAHPSLPKRHRWSKVRTFDTGGGRVFRDRICHTCGLTKGADE